MSNARRAAVIALSVVIPLAAAPRLAGQHSPFLPGGVYDALVGEISGDIAFEHVRWFTHYHRPMGGNEGYEAVARYVEQKAKDFRLDDVRVIKLPFRGTSWTPRAGELWGAAPERRRLAFAQEIPLALADYSRDADFESVELVDVGDGDKPSAYGATSVAGKIVLASGPLSAVMEEAVWSRGALGIVAFTTARVPDFPDQYPWMRIPIENAAKTKQGTFAFVLPYREGMRLRRDMAAGGAVFKVSGRVRSEFHQPSQSIVEASIRGTDIHDRDIVLTGHLQEEMFSANDDASGCANVLEIARALRTLIDEKRLPPPRRDIRFWWANEISAEEEYFAQQPSEVRQLLANVNQDMVGARQSAGSRAQFVTRPPFSRASFLGDVVESVVASLVEGNTSYLAAGQARQVARGVAQPGAEGSEDIPFSRPILSRLGSRERYAAHVVPFHNNTDHQVFNMALVGVPAVTFTNWPDPYIHSSSDDLWQVDPTQLKRNAVAVAAVAIYLASIGDDQVPTLGALMLGRGQERIARDTTTAVRMLAEAPREGRAAAYARAANLVRESARRERRAIESLRALVTAGGPAERALARLVPLLPTEAVVETRLAALYTGLTGEKGLPAAGPSPRELTLAKRIPSLVADLGGFLVKRDKLVRPPRLHALMAYETLNFVDGARSYLDIYRAVAAEADAAGEWYYGSVTLDDVAAYLDSAASAGIVIVR